MMIWFLVLVIVVLFVALTVQTFKLQESKMFIGHLRYEMKQMERSDSDLSRDLDEFLQFHREIRKNLNIGDTESET